MMLLGIWHDSSEPQTCSQILMASGKLEENGSTEETSSTHFKWGSIVSFSYAWLQPELSVGS